MKKLPTGRFVKVHSVRKNKNGTLDVLFSGTKKRNPKKKRAVKKKTAKRKKKTAKRKTTRRRR